MAIQFDTKKSRKNIADKSRGFGFELAIYFDWKTCVTYPDERKDYGEKRFVSIGFIHGRLYAVVWTKRQKIIRIISLRKANKREGKFYEKERA